MVVAEIPELEPAQRPCFYTGAGMTKGSFVRVSDGDRRLSAYEVQVMLSSRGQPREDEQAVSGTTADGLVPASVDTLVARLRTSRPYAFKDLDRLAVLRGAKVLVDGQHGEDATPWFTATCPAAREARRSKSRCTRTGWSSRIPVGCSVRSPSTASARQSGAGKRSCAKKDLSSLSAPARAAPRLATAVHAKR